MRSFVFAISAIAFGVALWANAKIKQYSIYVQKSNSPTGENAFWVLNERLSSTEIEERNSFSRLYGAIKWMSIGILIAVIVFDFLGVF